MKFSQFSLRELLLGVLCMGLGVASLYGGGALASIVVFFAFVLTTGMAIVAFIRRGRPQTIAIGFLVPVIMYAASVRGIGQSELDPYEGRLPTSKLLLPVFRVLVRQMWTNTMTGEAVPDYDPASDPDPMGVAGPYGGSLMALAEYPDRVTFMSLGHILMAMIFGYAGAKFAVGIHRDQGETDGAGPS